MVNRICQGDRMPSHSAAERAALADALTEAGPHHPTLCDGWTTTQLAAHLVIRERRPDAAVGIVLPAMAGWTARVQGQYAAQRAYDELVDAFRNGPPRLSAMSLPGVDARVNLTEHFVHCEDVRRAVVGQPGWVPRELPEARQRALWAQLSVAGKGIFRKSPVTVTLRTPAGRSKTVVTREGGDSSESGQGVTLVGEPAELILYAFGRKDHAQVQLEGPDDAVAAFRELALRV
jgi:uncharacterized protein (TIGR03085 family)